MKRISQNKIEADVTIKYWHFQDTDVKGKPLSNIVIIHYSDGEYSFISTNELTNDEIDKLDQLYKRRTKLKLILSVKEDNG